MQLADPPSSRLGAYVAIGLVVGVFYVFADMRVDAQIERGALGATASVLHGLIDHVIPIAAGALLGIAVHYLQLRSRLARSEALRADDLHARLVKVERDQAVWVVATATLHEVKNPLHALGLLLDEVVEGDPADASGRATLLTRARNHMGRIRDNLDVLRNFADHARPAVAPVVLEDIARDVARDLTPLARERGAEIRVICARSVRAVADPLYVRIILENLVSNGLDAMHASQRTGSVDIELSSAARRATVLVRDDGPGVDALVGEMVFEPLATSKARGLGLGLPIARALARAMDGDLTLESNLTSATTFALRLPEALS